MQRTCLYGREQEELHPLACSQSTVLPPAGRSSSGRVLRSSKQRESAAAPEQNSPVSKTKRKAEEVAPQPGGNIPPSKRRCQKPKEINNKKAAHLAEDARTVSEGSIRMPAETLDDAGNPKLSDSGKLAAEPLIPAEEAAQKEQADVSSMQEAIPEVKACPASQAPRQPRAPRVPRRRAQSGTLPFQNQIRFFFLGGGGGLFCCCCCCLLIYLLIYFSPTSSYCSAASSYDCQ
jgi:hypothetical protein